MRNGTAKRQRASAASNYPSGTLRKPHQRPSKSGLTDRDRASWHLHREIIRTMLVESPHVM